MAEHFESNYAYHTADPAGQSAVALADRIIGILRRFSGVAEICDLGCGNGYLSRRLAASGYKVTGVDASTNGIRLAKETGAAGAAFLCAPVDLPLVETLGRRFDAVVASEVIEHFYRPLDLLRVAHGILKPGGVLLLTTPYHGYLKNLLIALLGHHDKHFNPLWEGGHIKFFSIPTLRALLLSQGFENVRFDFFGRVPLLAKSMVSTARRKT